jgi:hypothetical protein
MLIEMIETFNLLGDSIPETSSSDSSEKNQPDLLHIVYVQSAIDVSAVEVNMLNMTAFVSLDAILDLTDVLTANVFAVMEVISASPAIPTTDMPTSLSPIPSIKSHNSESGIKENSIKDNSSLTYADTTTLQTPEIYPTNTMNVVVNITNPRLILLEDPTTAQSRAIVGRYVYKYMYIHIHIYIYIRSYYRTVESYCR